MTEAELKEQYLREMYEMETSQGQASASPSSFLEETHPDVSWQDRALIKNLSNNPMVGAEYLSKKGFQTQVIDGNIYAKKPGEKDYKALDPKGFDVQDITDLGYDIPAGALQSAATAASGVAGALATAPVGGAGAIPAAMAGGAASGAGLEYLRQKLGQKLGLPQEVKGKDVAFSAALGAASPVVFGTGAQTLKGLTEAAKQSQRSLVTRGVEKIFPTIARGSSGIPKEAINTYINKTKQVDDLIEQGPDAAALLSEKTYGQIEKQILNAKKDIGQKLSKKIKDADELITTEKIFEPLEKEIDTLVNSELSMTTAGQARIQALRNKIDSFELGLPEKIKPETAWSLKDDLYKTAKKIPLDATPEEKDAAYAMLKAYKAADEELESVAKSKGLMKEYSNLRSLEDTAEKHFGDAVKTERTLMNIDKPSKGQTRVLLDRLESVVGKTPVKENAELLQAYKEFQNPELLPKSGGGTTSTSRSLSLMSLLEAFGGLGGEQGAKWGRAIGSVAGGPMATKVAIKGAQYIAPKVGANPALVSPWLQLGTKDWLKEQAGN